MAVFTKEESSGREPRAGVQRRRKVIWSTPFSPQGPACRWRLCLLPASYSFYLSLEWPWGWGYLLLLPQVAFFPQNRLCLNWYSTSSSRPELGHVEETPLWTTQAVNRFLKGLLRGQCFKSSPSKQLYLNSYPFWTTTTKFSGNSAEINVFFITTEPPDNPFPLISDWRWEWDRF